MASRVLAAAKMRTGGFLLPAQPTPAINKERTILRPTFMVVLYEAICHLATGGHRRSRLPLFQPKWQNSIGELNVNL